MQAFGTGSDDSTCRFFDIRSCGEVSEFKNDMVRIPLSSLNYSRIIDSYSNGVSFFSEFVLLHLSLLSAVDNVTHSLCMYPSL